MQCGRVGSYTEYIQKRIQMILGCSTTGEYAGIGGMIGIEEEGI